MRIVVAVSDTPVYAPKGNRRRTKGGSRLLSVLAWTVALACLLPMVAVFLAAVTGGTDTVSHLMELSLIHI